MTRALVAPQDQQDRGAQTPRGGRGEPEIFAVAVARRTGAGGSAGLIPCPGTRARTGSDEQ